ncbi:4930_t:CDS:2 [Entrophospora sp. SA101]|nr:4930_t:CDS:2 [Entrophospora sp. SA101]
MIKDCDDNDSIENLIGIIKTIDDSHDIFIQTTKTNVHRQIISIADKDNNEVKLTLWGRACYT